MQQLWLRGKENRTFRLVGRQFQAVNMHVLYSLGIVLKKAEIVDRVPVDGVAVDLFMVIEDAVAPERAGTDDVAIRQDISGGYA